MTKADKELKDIENKLIKKKKAIKEITKRVAPKAEFKEVEFKEIVHVETRKRINWVGIFRWIRKLGEKLKLPEKKIKAVPVNPELFEPMVVIPKKKIEYREEDYLEIKIPTRKVIIHDRKD